MNSLGREQLCHLGFKINNLRSYLLHMLIHRKLTSLSPYTLSKHKYTTKLFNFAKSKRFGNIFYKRKENEQ